MVEPEADKISLSGDCQELVDVQWQVKDVNPTLRLTIEPDSDNRCHLASAE